MWTIAVSGKKKLWIQKYPDTCGRGLSLYVLFFHFRPRDATRGNSFFQMARYARANVRIANEKKKQKENSHEGITWSKMAKQNVQDIKVCCHALVAV